MPTPRDLVWVTCCGWLLTLACLALYAAAPAVLGWSSRLILTGSMEPALHPGDVVVLGPPPDTGPLTGFIVGLPPSAPGRRPVVHRVVGERDGLVTTQGDANSAADRPATPRDDVTGVARLVVPGAGRTTLALRRREPADLVWLAAIGLATAGLLLVEGLDRRDRGPKRTLPPPIPAPRAAPPRHVRSLQRTAR